jgi:hypothetical protein
MLCICIRTIQIHLRQCFYLFINIISCAHMRKYIGIYIRLFRRKALSFSLSLKSDHTHTRTHTNQMSEYVSLLYCTRTDWLMMECILSCRRAARHTCKHLSKTVAVIRRIQVHMSMYTHVHAYVGRVCDEMGLFLSHRLAHIHIYVFGAEKGVCKYVVDATVFDSRLAAIKSLSWRCSILAPHKKDARARVLTYVCVSSYIYSSSWNNAQHWYRKLGRSRRAKVCMSVFGRMSAYGAFVCEEIRLFWVID